MGLNGKEVVRWVPSGQAGQVPSSLHYPLPAGRGQLPALAHPAQTHVPQVEGDFQLTPEAVCKRRVHVQYLQQVCPLDLVQVTVGQGPHICTGLAWPGMKANGLPKDVVLSCQPEGQGSLQGLAPSCLLKSLPEGPLTMNSPHTSLNLRVPARLSLVLRDQALGTRLDVLAEGRDAHLFSELCRGHTTFQHVSPLPQSSGLSGPPSVRVPLLFSMFFGTTPSNPLPQLQETVDKKRH